MSSELRAQIEQDVKTALRSGDKDRTEVLRGLKSAILYAEVAANARDKGLPEDVLLAVIAKESKKRAESAELYEKAGAHGRAQKELAEKAIIDDYLPAQIDDEQLQAIVEEVVAAAGSDAQMGPVIAEVRKQAGPLANGARIAALVKAKIGK